MKYNLILWLFYFVYCAICLNHDHQQAKAEPAATVFFVNSPEASPISLNNTTETLQVGFKEINENKNIAAAEYSLLSIAELERSTLFTGYDRGTNPSLLVVERWESSSINDHSSFNTDPINFTRGKITNGTELRTDDYMALLLSSNADEVIAPSIKKSKGTLFK